MPENALTYQFNELLRQCNIHNDQIKHKKSLKKGRKAKMANVCMLLKIKDIAISKEVKWCAERKLFLEQVQSVTKNILMIAKADANIRDHIEQLVTEKCVLEQRLDELEETCMLREQCIASLGQREAGNETAIEILERVTRM